MRKIIIERLAKFINNDNKIYYRLECSEESQFINGIEIINGEVWLVICMEGDIHSAKLFEYIRDTYDKELKIHSYTEDNGGFDEWIIIGSIWENGNLYNQYNLGDIKGEIKLY